tara:strand:- start:163 stop:450 length:288 start_codon:yes stop_codon:yes gene_type:complete
MSKLMKSKKLAAVQLAIQVETASEAVATAQTETEKIEAATALAFLFNDNVELMIWALKYSGDLPSAKRDKSPTQPSRPLGQVPDISDLINGNDAN